MSSSSPSADEDFVAFVTGASGALTRLANAICPDRGRAQDLVQESLVSTYLKWPKVKDGDPWAYARTCLVNKNISYWRRRPWREVGSASIDVDDNAESAIDPDTVETRELLRQALRGLTPKERTTVVLRHIEGLSERETAETMHVAVGTVKSTCARAIAKLNAAMSLAEEQIRGA